MGFLSFHLSFQEHPLGVHAISDAQSETTPHIGTDKHTGSCIQCAYPTTQNNEQRLGLQSTLLASREGCSRPRTLCSSLSTRAPHARSPPTIMRRDPASLALARDLRVWPDGGEHPKHSAVATPPFHSDHHHLKTRNLAMACIPPSAHS
jgi:hypothetical protein